MSSLETADTTTLATAITRIAARADQIDLSGAWPGDDLNDLAAAGVMRAAIPREYGGEDDSAVDLHLRYERIAAASLSTALILTQRDSACGLIDGAAGCALREPLLRELGRNEWFATVGIAQLTTSRQRGAPALIATPTENGYRLDGLIPWSTGAAAAKYIVAGAVAEAPSGERRQILFALPRDLEGVTIGSPMRLVAMRSTNTSSVICNGAVIGQNLVLAGPTEQVLANRKRTLPIGQAFLAMGLCRGALDLIARHDSAMARETLRQFEAQLAEVRSRVLGFCRAEAPDPALGPELRGRCNELAVRITHAAVAIYKGSALLEGHPAQRLARESMFLLVWSCPNPVIDCTVELMRVPLATSPGRS